jgi:hypothetical protein
MEFSAFPKIARLAREVVITEKIDGTNAQIAINEWGEMFIGSRNRWITPTTDNHGFAAWARENKDELFKLGPGQHFGEWWGQGIQRRYGLTEKRFSLFNTARWGNAEGRPTCCSAVPVIYRGMFSTDVIEDLIQDLRTKGSVAAPGFMDPEGIVIYHTAAGISFKKTLVRDDLPKGCVASEVQAEVAA